MISRLTCVPILQSMSDVLSFVGTLAEAAGPILVLTGVNAGTMIMALIGTLAGALSVVVGQGLQELAAQAETPQIPEIPESPPVVVTTNTGGSTGVNQVNTFSKIPCTNVVRTLL